MMTAAGLAAGAAVAPVSAQRGAAGSARAAAEETQSRYQIAQMERVLEGAVEHGATVWRNRLQAVMPADWLLSENARVRGFRLDGYGVFFDVQVPMLEGTLLWSFRTLDQNGLGLASAWNVIRSSLEAQAATNDSIQQALKRLELQVTPMMA